MQPWQTQQNLPNMSLKFLNKKGWHTQSMQNQTRLFEARAKETARKKAEEEREAELRQVCT